MIPLILKALPFLAKLASISKWFAFIPGGQIIAVVGTAISALLGFVASFCKWLLADIVDAFKEPQRLVVRVLCGLVVLGVGVHQGIKWDAKKVDAARAETAAIKADLRKQEKEDAALATAAKAAREEAARRALAAPVAQPAPVAAADPAPAPVGMQPKRPAPAKRKEPSVPWSFFADPK